MSKNQEVEFNPVKETVGGKQAEKVIWSTNIINVALKAIEEGKPLKASPFYMKNTKLLKPELVYKRTKEEIDDYIKCINDYWKKNIIDKLKLDLSKEPDPIKQANILKEIMKIRGVKTSD